MKHRALASETKQGGFGQAPTLLAEGLGQITPVSRCAALMRGSCKVWRGARSSGSPSFGASSLLHQKTSPTFAAKKSEKGRGAATHGTCYRWRVLSSAGKWGAPQSSLACGVQALLGDPASERSCEEPWGDSCGEGKEEGRD